MIQTQVLIVGQGISGTWLSHWLNNLGQDFYVIDAPTVDSSSQVAGGSVNPVTGRRMVETWMANTLIPFALAQYRQLETQLALSLVNECRIYDFFSSPDRRLAFIEKAERGSAYLQWPTHTVPEIEQFNYELGYGIITGGFQVQLQPLLAQFRKALMTKNRLLEAHLQEDELAFDHERQFVKWRHITAQKIIFCDGTHATQNRWFKNLPLTPTSGECLIIDVPGLLGHHIYKKGLSIMPLRNGTFWVGSNYKFHAHKPERTSAFYQQTQSWLHAFLKLPFTIVDHRAGLRPTTIDRRPMVGFHPQNPMLGILNGLGTKGVSLAPWFAHQMAEHLVFGRPIMPDVEVQRFKKLLLRS